MAKSMSDLADDFDKKYESDIQAKADAFDRQYKDPSLEDSPIPGTGGMTLNKNIYPAMGKVASAGKELTTPFRMAMSPIGYGANKLSNYLQDKPQEPDPSSASDFVDKYGTTGALTRTMDTGSQTLGQGLDEAPGFKSFIQQQLPKAYSNTKDISQKDAVTGMMDADVTGKMAENIPLTPKINGKVPAISQEGAVNYVRSLAKDNGQLKALESSGKIYDLAKLVQDDPDTYLHQFQPNKVYENLQGDLNKGTGSRDLGTGAIAQATEAQNKFIDDLPTNTYSIPKEEMNIAAKAKLNGMGTLEAGQRAGAEGIIDRNIEVNQPDPAKIAKIKAVQDTQSKLDDLNKTSQFDLTPNPRNAADKIRLESFVKKNFDPSAPDVESYLETMRQRNSMPAGYSSDVRRLGNKLQEAPVPGEVSTDVASKNLAGKAMSQAGQDAQNDVMGSDSVPQEHVDKYNALNKKISTMISMRDLLSGNLADAGNTDAGLVPGALASPGRYVAKNFNRYIRPTVEQGASSVANAGASAVNNSPMGDISRFANTLPMQLVKYQIPRDSQQILENKHVVLAKIAQMSGDDPTGMVPMFKDALENHPELLPKALPAMVMKFPDLFEPDDYSRVDGKIFDPTMKSKALHDLQNDKTMDIRTKAFKAKRLQEEGIYQ